MADLSLKYLLFGEDKTASKSIKGVADTAEKSAGRMSSASKLIAAGAVAAGAAVFAFGKSSVDAYIDASKQHRVLEDAYKRFPAIADVTISSMDAQAAALMNVTKFDDDAISSAQGLLAQYKLTGSQIQQLIPLVLDYAQKTGRDLPSATEVVGKALLGQGRALKDIGVNFKDTGSRAGNFTELMGALRTQVGGFAEQEGKSAEGRAAILANRFGNLQEAIGERLLPVMEFAVDEFGQVVDVAGNLIDVASKIPAPVYAAAAAFVAWHVAGERVVGVGGRVVSSASKVGDSLRLAGMYARDAGGGFTGLKAGLSALSGGLTTGQAAAGGLKTAAGGLVGLLGGPWGIALAGATVAVAAFAQANANSRADVDTLADTLDKVTGKFTEASRKFVAENFSFNVSPEDLASLERAGVVLEDVTTAALGTNSQYEAMRQRLSDVNHGTTDAAGAAAGMLSALDNMRGKANDANAQFQVQNKLVGDNATKTDAAAGSSDIFAGAVDGVASAAAGAKIDMQKLNDQIAEHVQLTLTARGTTRDYEQAIDDANAAVKANGKTLNVHTEAGRKNQAALDRIAESALAVAEADLKQGKSTGEVTAKVKLANDAFVAAAVKMGMKKDRAKALAGQLGLTAGQVQLLTGKVKGIPDKKETKVTVPTGKATTQAKTIQDKIDHIRGKNVPVTITLFGLGPLVAAQSLLAGIRGVAGSVGHNASGTSNWRGGLTWVGERGPELVSLPAGTAIYDAQTSAAMASGSARPAAAAAASDRPLEVNLYIGPDKVHTALLRYKQDRGGGGLGFG